MTTRSAVAGALVAAAALTACSSAGRPTAAQSGTTATPAPASPATPVSPSTTGATPATPAIPATATGPGPLSSVTLDVPAAFANGAFATARVLQAPAGSTVSVWASIPGARFIVETPEKALLVSVPGSGSLVLLTPGSDPSAPPATTTIATGIDAPQGMAFDTLDGKPVLYVAGVTTLARYAWTGTGLGAQTTILSGLPGNAPGYAHPAKEVAVAPNHDVYLDLGSATNADPANRAAGEAKIIRVPAGQTHSTVVMTGVRNGDGLSFDPAGQLWTAVNMRDRVANPAGQVVQSYVNDHPPDEIVKVTPGRDLGWPYCDPDQSLSQQTDPYGNVPLRDDPETDAGGTVDCAKLPAVERGIHAHSAPLGFHFLQGSSLPANYLTGAVLATHGSNNAVPPRPAELDWLPFASGTLGAVQPFLTGFIDASGDRWGKPVDAAAGADGSLYVTDDTAGAVYRLTLATAASKT